MQKISRSGVEKYLGCPRCFVLQYRYKVSLSQIPFTLNSAVDELCKNEFDHYREKGEPHPLFLEHNIDAIPFMHADIDKWRNSRQGLSYTSEEHGYHFYGAIDDVWVKPNGHLIVSDVKSTSKKIFDWNETKKYEYARGYQRQLEMYQWLFRKNGFEVSDTAYLVYYNGKKNEPMFNQVLKFDLHVAELECNADWVEDKVIEAVRQLSRDEIPTGKKYCNTCQYLKKRWDVYNNVGV